MNAPSLSPEPAVIDGTAQITPAWVQSVLRHSGLPDAMVRAVSAEPIGAGNVSDCVRVAITYDAAPGGAPAEIAGVGGIPWGARSGVQSLPSFSHSYVPS